jgi:AcrR family transcriptional regulator
MFRRMATEFTGGSDPGRSIALLWGVAGAPRRGPKPRRTVEEVVDAAIALADADGLAALSVRRVAETLGLSTMSLYTYVPSKAELIDLMLDRVAAEGFDPAVSPPDWRGKLEAIARNSWARAQRHPWIMQIGAHRPPLGPHIMAQVEATLSAIDGLGLHELEMDRLTALIGDYVRGSARSALEAREVEHLSGMTDDQWWAIVKQLLKGLVDPKRYPTAVRVGAALEAAKQTGGAEQLGRFEFGLQRVLDGIEVFISARRSEPTPPG